MGARKDFVYIEAGGIRLNRWQSYRVDSDLLIPADDFTLDVDVPTGDEEVAREQVIPGTECRLFIERTDREGRRFTSLQMTGYIEKRKLSISRSGGLSMKVSGRDRASLLVDSNVPPGLIREDASGSTTFVDLVVAAVARWGFDVITSDSAERNILTGERQRRRLRRLERAEARAEGVPPAAYSRGALETARASGTPLDTSLGITSGSQVRYANSLTPSDIQRIQLRQAAPRIGETVWGYLTRHARRLGLMMWMTADGKIVVGSPDYGQRPTGRLIRRVRPRSDDMNTVEVGTLEDSNRERYSAAVCYGRASGRDASLSRLVGTARDTEWVGPDKIRYVSDPTARDQAAVDRRAARELALGKVKGRTLNYEVVGPGPGETLWAQNSIAYVFDERFGLDDNFFVIGRTLAADRKDGSSTALQLVPRGAITL